MVKRLEFTEEQVKVAIANSSSTKEFLIALGMKVNNGNYRKAAEICFKHNLVVPKSTPSEQSRSVSNFNKLSDEEYFRDGVLRNGQGLKKRLIQDHGFIDVCSECGQEPFWNGKPLTLQVDHIDGNRFNNKIDNLRILCGHCHSQTDTYSNNRSATTYSYCECGVRIDIRFLKCSSCIIPGEANIAPLSEEKAKETFYCSCGEKKSSRKASSCRSCSMKKLSNSNIGKTKIEYPEINELIARVAEFGFSTVSKELGVSDNSIRNHIARVAGKDAVPKGYPKVHNIRTGSKAQDYLLTADVNEIVKILNEQGMTITKYARSISTTPKILADWLESKLGVPYSKPRNIVKRNPNTGSVEYPELDVLLGMMANIGAERTAGKIGVTSKAIDRHLRKFLPEDVFPLRRTGFLESYVVK